MMLMMMMLISTLKLEATYSFEISVHIFQTTWCPIPENRVPQTDSFWSCQGTPYCMLSFMESEIVWTWSWNAPFLVPFWTFSWTRRLCPSGMWRQYQRFRETCCLHLYGRRCGYADSPETLVVRCRICDGTFRKTNLLLISRVIKGGGTRLVGDFFLLK